MSSQEKQNDELASQLPKQRQPLLSDNAVSPYFGEAAPAPVHCSNKSASIKASQSQSFDRK